MSSTKQNKIKQYRKSFRKSETFLYEIYPYAETVHTFLVSRCNITNISTKIKSSISNTSYNTTQLYDETIDFFHKSIIYIPTEHISQLPNISEPQTNIKQLIEDFLRNKFSNGSYNRKDNVLTLSYYPMTSQYNGKNKFIPLLNVDSIVLNDGSDEINYLITNKYCQIFHELIGDNIFYYLLNKASIFINVKHKSNQYWQLMGQPSNKQMWKSYKKRIPIHKPMKQYTQSQCMTGTMEINNPKNRHAIVSNYIIKKWQKKMSMSTESTPNITENIDTDTNIDKSPPKSILGKRKSKPLYLAKPANKYRRTNDNNSTCISSQRNKPKPMNKYRELAAKCDIKLNRKFLSVSENLNRSNLNKLIIKRYNIFYGGKNCGQYNILNPKNILNILPPTNFGSELLIRYIFFNQHLSEFKNIQKRFIANDQILNQNSQKKYKFNGTHKWRKNKQSVYGKRQKTDCNTKYIPTRRLVRFFGGKLPRRYRKLIPFFKRLIINYQCKMNWYCFREAIEGTIADKIELKMNLQNVKSFKDKLKTLIEYKCCYNNVWKFVNSFLNRLFHGLNHWGIGQKNVAMLNQFIMVLIRGQRHIKFTMGDALNGMDPMKVFEKWALEQDKNNGVHARNIKWKMLIGFCQWLLNDIIIDMLRFNFYITECSYKEASRTTYYGCKIWKAIVGIYLKQNDGMFQMIEKHELNALKKDSNLGIGFLRFVPKPNSLRPIINQSRHSFLFGSNINKKKKLIAPNKKLNQLFFILTHSVNKYKMANKKQDILGSSVFSVREYYHNWLLFVKKYNMICDRPKIYCVSADLSKCYDRINQDVLMTIVSNKLLYKPDYRLIKYNAIYPEIGRIFQKWKYAVDYGQIQDIANSLEFQNRTMLISNDGYRKLIANKDILQLLHAAITHSIVYLNGKYYKHNVGISQGSIISQLLCCVYIGQCEKLIVSKILRDCSNQNNQNTVRLMMRHVDDFIFFTTNKKEAVLFADILHAGIDAFNMIANMDKTTTNFKYEWNGNECAISNPWISWCGFLWNTETLNVRAHWRDHTLNIKQNLLVSSIKTPNGVFIINKLTKLIRHKITPLLLDENINNKYNVIYNLYQSFYVSGARFVRFVIHLPHKNEYYLWNVLMELVAYTSNKIHIAKKKASLNKKMSMKFSLKFKEMQYIAGRGYKHAIMNKYHGLFSREFQQKLNKFIYLRSKNIKPIDKDMFHKYTDFNQLMHQKLHDFVF